MLYAQSGRIGNTKWENDCAEYFHTGYQRWDSLEMKEGTGSENKVY